MIEISDIWITSYHRGKMSYSWAHCQLYALAEDTECSLNMYKLHQQLLTQDKKYLIQVSNATEPPRLHSPAMYTSRGQQSLIRGHSRTNMNAA